ncbi:MAG: ATP-binding protein, partial [Anaerolineaceae bacterium]|nr:ATP-binding protein [Anaerolineaceae bacterium]
LGDEIMVCVSDQGKGFDPKDIPFVFDRFYRSEKDAKSTKGTGLGLYLCKSIVLAHGGRIWIDEEYKEGARVCFSLPVD